MLRAATLLRRLFIAAALAGELPALGSDQAIRAEVQHALATPYRTDDPEVAAFTLKFDVRLTSRSTTPVVLPILKTNEGETTRVSVLGAQSKQPEGTWTYLLRSSWYDTGTLKYESCISLSSTRTAEIKNVASGFVLLKKQLAGLGSEPTVRLNLWFFCQQPDGTVLIKSATTDAFVLRLPTQP